MASGVWTRLRGWVQQLFNITPQQSDDALTAAEYDAQQYYDNTRENITALIANALATLAFGDASISVTGDDSARVEMLDALAQKEFANSKRNIAAALGVGMIATIPYSVDTGLGRKIYTSTVTRDRIYITGVQGSDITQCVVLADAFEDADGKSFYRWTSYTVDNGVYTITNKATESGTEIPLTAVQRWAAIPPEVQIAGVERLPIGIFRCPTANRRPDDITGVPITFGCDATLHKIAQTLEDIELEFNRKKVRIMADRTYLRNEYDGNGNVIHSGLEDDIFLRMGESDQLRLDIFDPALRESSYFNKLQQHFALLEKEVGVSRGILTDMATQGATATEIRRSMYQTFCLLDDIHREYEQYLEQLMYGINVLANFYGIESDAEYEINYDWSYALLEDTTETFNQMMQGNSIGAISNAEIRAFITDEDLETAAAKVAEQKQTNLITNEFLGMVDNSPTFPAE
jgi:A118 family predicted phage portal protein